MTMTDLTFKCRGKCGQLLPEVAFPKSGPYKGKYYRRSICKQCINRQKWKLRRIPLSTVRPHLLEIVNRTGSQRAAAKAVGVSPTQLRHWLGLAYRYRKDGRQYKATSITRTSAAQILNTLRLLRREDTHYDHANRPGTKPYWFKVDDRDARYKRDRRRNAA